MFLLGEGGFMDAELLDLFGLDAGHYYRVVFENDRFELRVVDENSEEV